MLTYVFRDALCYTSAPLIIGVILPILATAGLPMFLTNCTMYMVIILV